MPEYKKVGYLTSGFKMFHLKEQNRQDFSYHYHDFHKILILLHGDITYCIEGRTYDLLPGDIVLVHAGEVHRPIIKSENLYERIIIYVSPAFLSANPETGCDLGLCFAPDFLSQSHVLRFPSAIAGKVQSAVNALDISIDDKDFAAELRQKLLFLEFMIQLNRATLHNGVQFIANSPSDGKITEVLNYLSKHLTEDISITDLSAQFYLSRYYLMHAFKEQTGYTIGHYISTKRLLLAKDFVACGMPITEACYACGFKNYSTFSRAYKKCFGESPRESRQSTSV